MKRQWILLAALALLLAGSMQAQNRRTSEVRATLEVFLTQLDLAIQQAAFGAFSVTLQEAKVQARHVLNVAVGESDASFDAAVPNLGDGVGLINYVRRLNRFMEQTDEFDPYRVTVNNILFFLSASTELLKQSLRLQHIEDVRRQIRISQGLLLAARGAPGDLPSEGGVRTLLALFAD